MYRHYVKKIMKGKFIMPRKGENIHKRSDGRWEGRYRNGRDLNGQIIYRSVYGKTYREVKDKMLQSIMEVEQIPTVSKYEKHFKEVCNLWLENNRIRYKGATCKKYKDLLDTHIIPEFGDVYVSQITAPMINRFLKRKLESGRIDNKGGLSSSYVRSIMLVIGAVMKFAAEEQFCQPLKSSINKPTVSSKELSLLDLEEQNRLENFLRADIDNTKVGILITMHTGLRIGEICALSWDDIDFKNNVIHVRHTVARIKDNLSESSSKFVIDLPKTSSSIRDIPISSFLLPILKKLKQNTKFPYIVSNTASFTNPRTYEYRYHKVLNECGIESVNYHVLRHTFATRCINAGVDVKSLSEILGHANVSITLNTYVHSSLEMKRAQLEKTFALSA